MAGVMAIGVGYVLILTFVVTVFLVLRVQQNSLEKRLDALVQMARIPGEVVGVHEISQSLIIGKDKNRLRRQGIILLTTAVGFCAASVIGGGEPLVIVSVIMGALGMGFLLVDRLPGDGSLVHTDVIAS